MTDERHERGRREGLRPRLAVPAAEIAGGVVGAGVGAALADPPGLLLGAVAPTLVTLALQQAMAQAIHRNLSDRE